MAIPDYLKKGARRNLNLDRVDNTSDADKLLSGPIKDALLKINNKLNGITTATDLGILTDAEGSPVNIIPILNSVLANIPVNGSLTIDFNKPGGILVNGTMNSIPSNKQLHIRTVPGVFWGGSSGREGLRYTSLDSGEDPREVFGSGGRSYRFNISDFDYTNKNLMYSAYERGLVRVEFENGNFVMYDQQTLEQEKEGTLRPVFCDGTMLVDEFYETIRARLHLQSR